MILCHHLPVVGIFASLAGHVLCSPFRHAGIALDKRAEQLALNHDFPDPSIEQVSYEKFEVAHFMICS